MWGIVVAVGIAMAGPGIGGMDDAEMGWDPVDEMTVEDITRTRRPRTRSWVVSRLRRGIGRRWFGWWMPPGT